MFIFGITSNSVINRQFLYMQISRKQNSWQSFQKQDLKFSSQLIGCPDFHHKNWMETKITAALII